MERIKIFESDNPLFGNVERRFIPMFTSAQVNEMVDDLGSIMGVHFDDECKTRLHTDFGGHPFLTRYACSSVSSATNERPVEIDRTVYSAGIKKFKTESNFYVESVVGLLRDEYPDEFEMLKSLGHRDVETFNMFANSDPTLCEHLLGYGIVAQGKKSFYFRIGAVERYFENMARPTALLSQQERLAEISAKRNALERDFRSLINQVFKISFSSKDRLGHLVGKLAPARREAVSTKSFSELISTEESPLYFDELKTVILGNWEKFSNFLDMEKSEFEYHMTNVNKTRKDAHANDVDDLKFEKWRVSIAELASRLAE